MDGSAFVVVAGIFLGYAALSRRLQGTSITAPIVFVGAGFVVGTEGLGWLNLSSDQHTVSVLAEAYRVDVELIDIMRFDDVGLVCDHWGVADMLSLMQQIGAVTMDPPE